MADTGVAVAAVPVAAAGPRGVPERVALARRVDRRLVVAHTLAHGLGVLDVAALLIFVLPLPAHPDVAGAPWALIVAVAVYVPLAFVVGLRIASRMGPARATWLIEGRAPTPEERDAVLAHPMRCVRTDAGFWAGGALLVAVVCLPWSSELAFHIGSTVLLGGLTVSAVAFLIDEKLMRPITVLALAAGPPSSPVGPGVKGRLVLVWIFATGVPLLGLLMMACDALTQGNVSADRLAVGVLVLAGGGGLVGLLATLLVARALASPLGAVRRAQARVQAGDLSAEVEVDDGSEVGLLQSGFNRMAGGLREREEMRELFTRHVGQEVADAALASEPQLGGAVCDVSVLFVDLVGSTRLAATQPPERVVARLNRFFAVVVEVVEAQGGWINKFEGDAALCVFGAPEPLEGHAGHALSAARELHRRLAAAGIDAGVGVSSGPAVAGWIGTERRFEYTVIGDAVNEAARLCDAAKRDPRKLLASGAIVARADPDETPRWALGELLHLRGRTEPTRVAAPA